MSPPSSEQVAADHWFYVVYWSTFVLFLTGCYLVYLLVRYSRECTRKMSVIRQIVFPVRLDASRVSAKAYKIAERIRVAAIVFLSLVIFVLTFWAIQISRM